MYPTERRTHRVQWVPLRPRDARLAVGVPISNRIYGDRLQDTRVDLDMRTGHRDGLGTGHVAVLAVRRMGRRPTVDPVHLHVLPEGRWVGVGLITAIYSTVVWFIRGVHVRMLFPVGTVGESPITAIELAFEWFFACKQQKRPLGFSGFLGFANVPN